MELNHPAHMIGVSSETEKAVVTEFFELFKTPWEYCRPGVRYKIVLSTEDHADQPDTELLILSTPKTTAWDRSAKIQTSPCAGNCQIDTHGHTIPVFGPAICFRGEFMPISSTAQRGGTLIFDKSLGRTAILRIGYDIFLQVKHLLTTGQSRKYAAIPALEVHIDILRQGLMRWGIPFVEIPPVPAGKTFFACLTHDVDFYRISDHLCDHTFFGFIYRAFLGEGLNILRGRGALKKMIQNWWALVRLPFVFLGLAPDIWTRFEQYAKLEKGLGATYYVIPFKQQPGHQPDGGHAPSRRATRYDVADLNWVVSFLEKSGYEIALHGIDAWRSPIEGRREANRIAHFIHNSVKGVRMHWLYLDDQTHRSLEKAGLEYDSSAGYNDAAGFRSGTAQVYRPLGTQRLLELPMILQDSALFYPDRMDLSEPEAWTLAITLIDKLKRFGGSLTINWHHRSIAPERLWGEFYLKLLQALKRHGACFLDAQTVVSWFRIRRQTVFKTVHIKPDTLKVVLECPGSPPAALTLRVYHPSFSDKHGTITSFREIPFTENIKKTIRIADMSEERAFAS